MDENGTRLARGQMPVSRTLRSGVPSRGTIIGIRIADGPVRWLSVNAEPLFNGTMMASECSRARWRRPVHSECWE